MELEIDLSDLKESAVRRMLLKAIRSEGDRSKPMHMRKGDKEMAQDDDADEADDENDKLVELHQEKGKPAPIPVTDEDVSEKAGKELVENSKKSPPKGKASAGKFKAKQPPKAKG